MLKRLSLYVLLAVLFAFTQIGMTTHEISHLNELVKHTQPDKKHNGNEPCTLCLGLSLLAGAMPASAAPLLPASTEISLFPPLAQTVVHRVDVAYAARAPPVILLLQA